MFIHAWMDGQLVIGSVIWSVGGQVVDTVIASCLKITPRGWSGLEAFWCSTLHAIHLKNNLLETSPHSHHFTYQPHGAVTGVVEGEHKVKVGEVKDVAVEVGEGHLSPATRHTRTIPRVNHSCGEKEKYIDIINYTPWFQVIMYLYLQRYHNNLDFVIYWTFSPVINAFHCKTSTTVTWITISYDQPSWKPLCLHYTTILHPTNTSQPTKPCIISLYIYIFTYLFIYSFIYLFILWTQSHLTTMRRSNGLRSLPRVNTNSLG